jgi:hypothetical protein
LYPLPKPFSPTRRLAASSLSYNNHSLIFLNKIQKLIPGFEDWEPFSLLLNAQIAVTCIGEVEDGFVRLLFSVSIDGTPCDRVSRRKNGSRQDRCMTALLTRSNRSWFPECHWRRIGCLTDCCVWVSLKREQTQSLT